jgi:hypothetical protein
MMDDGFLVFWMVDGKRANIFAIKNSKIVGQFCGG